MEILNKEERKEGHHVSLKVFVSWHGPDPLSFYIPSCHQWSGEATQALGTAHCTAESVESIE